LSLEKKTVAVLAEKSLAPIQQLIDRRQRPGCHNVDFLRLQVFDSFCMDYDGGFCHPRRLPQEGAFPLI